MGDGDLSMGPHTCSSFIDWAIPYLKRLFWGLLKGGCQGTVLMKHFKPRSQNRSNEHGPPHWQTQHEPHVIGPSFLPAVLFPSEYSEGLFCGGVTKVLAQRFKSGDPHVLFSYQILNEAQVT